MPGSVTTRQAELLQHAVPQQPGRFALNGAMRIAARHHCHRLTVNELPIAAVRGGPGEELVQRHQGWGAFAQRDHAERVAPLPSGVARR
jgi:hypothetical protein